MLQLTAPSPGHHICNHPAVNEQNIKELISKHVELGLNEAGYTYFNLDGAASVSSWRAEHLQASRWLRCSIRCEGQRLKQFS